VGEGLRWSGCDVLDIGPATAACLAFAVDHLHANGGISIGNPGHNPHTVGLQFWTAGPRPLSAGGSLEPLVQLVQSGVTRPTRSFGAMRRFQAEEPYLAAFAAHYHALRPLRIVVDSASSPLIGYVRKLAATVACQVIPCRVARHELPNQIRTDAAHLAVCIDGNAETCQVHDEQGRTVSSEQMLLLLAPDTGPIVLENTTPPPVIKHLERRNIRVVSSNPRRADMAAALREHGAQFGGGPSGRFWFAEAGVPLPDALMAVTRLLIRLSRTDAPLSAILDRDLATE
jgi:phosphomannomutase